MNQIPNPKFRRIVAELLASLARWQEFGNGWDSKAIASAIERSRVYVCPNEKRPVDDEGRYGSLHVKCAIADRLNAYSLTGNR